MNVTELLLDEINTFEILASFKTDRFLIEWTISANNNEYQRMKKVEDRLKNRISETMDWGQVFRKTMVSRIDGVLRCNFNRGLLQISLEIP